MLEVLGPFPERSLEMMEGILREAQARGGVTRTGKKAARAASKLATDTTHLRDVFNTVSGKLNRAGNGTVTSVSQANRSVVISRHAKGTYMPLAGARNDP